MQICVNNLASSLSWENRKGEVARATYQLTRKKSGSVHFFGLQYRSEEGGRSHWLDLAAIFRVTDATTCSLSSLEYLLEHEKAVALEHPKLCRAMRIVSGSLTSPL
jgi:hypothetical protein